MFRLSSVIAPLSAFLALVVMLQMWDLPGCADENLSTPIHASDVAHAEDHNTDPVNHHTDGRVLADCLCHLLFVADPEVPLLDGPNLALSLHSIPAVRIPTGYLPTAKPIPLS